MKTASTPRQLHAAECIFSVQAGQKIMVRHKGKSVLILSEQSLQEAPCQSTTSTTIKHLTSMSLEKSCENIYMPSSTAGWQRWSLIWCWKCVIATEADALRHSLTSGPSDLLNNFTTEQNSLCLCEKVYSLEMRVLSRSFNPFKPIPGGVGMLWCLFRQRAGRYSFFSYVFCI